MAKKRVEKKKISKRYMKINKGEIGSRAKVSSGANIKYTRVCTCFKMSLSTVKKVIASTCFKLGQ